MKHVTILALEHTIATTVYGPMDVFSQAGLLWNAIHKTPPYPFFQVEIATLGARPVTALNRVPITPHTAIEHIDDTDLIIIPSMTVTQDLTSQNHRLIEWLKYKYQQGAAIAGVCTGAFLLAATGLLDGKDATTHWGFQKQFTRMYPDVHLKPERLITDEGRLFCAGALGGGMDLSIYLMEKFCGREVALQCSKSLIHDMGRDSQSPYQVLQFHKDHADRQIKTIQKWVETHYQKSMRIERISKEHGMSRRTFERRFKKATGETPLSYLQRIRVEKAKSLLEKETYGFNEICHKVGYEDSSHFRRIFKKFTGLLPADYQKKFSSQRI